ncbi:MAG: LysM peptidoglycan-binding domain-containing protein, partial [Actinomycetota bacterium]
MTSVLQRFADLVRGLVGLALVLLLLVGIPALLLLLVGFPLPTEMPSAELIRIHIEDGDIPDAFLIKTLAVLVWIVWIQLALAIVVEFVALVRGRMSGRAPVLPGIQTFVGKLVASIVLIGSALTPTRAAVVAPIAAPVLAVESMFVDEAGAGRHDDSHVVEMPRVGGGRFADGADPSGRPPTTGGSYTTQSGDSWWDLAERLLGDGMRWSELRSLNSGRTMLNGDLVTDQTETVRGGWQLAVPVDADPRQLDADPADPADPAGPVHPATRPDRAGRSLVDALRPEFLVYEGPTGAGRPASGPAYQVVDGDNLWDIAERHLGDPFRWPEIFEASTALGQPSGLRITDPNLIWPDSILVLPVDAVDVPAPDPDLVEAVLGAAAPATPTTAVDPAAEAAPPETDGAGVETDLRPGPTSDDLRRMAERAAEAAPAPPVAPEPPGRGGAPGPGHPGGPGGGVELERPTDTADGESPALDPGVLAVGSGALLVATGLLGLLRRSRRLRLSETGEASIPEPPPIDLFDIETVLRQRADTPAAERLIGAVSSLAAGAAVGEPWPIPVAVRVAGDRVEAVVTDGGGPLPVPWREVAVDGGVLPPGQRAAAALLHDLDEVVADVGSDGRHGGEPGSGSGDGPVPVPALASVGAGLLVNLEAVGVVALGGADGGAEALGRSIVHELGTTVGPTGGRPPVDVLVSDGVGGVDLHPVVRAGPVDRLVAEADAWLGDVELALAASAAGGSWGLAPMADGTDRARTLVVVVSGDDVG